MYNLEFLPIAKNDMIEIIKYISEKLESPLVASKLADDFINAAEKLCEFPYTNNVYSPIKPLEYEYRRIIVKNYLIFYTVDEQNKNVTIMRVIYAQRDIENQL